jgi:hypothetical protein
MRRSRWVLPLGLVFVVTAFGSCTRSDSSTPVQNAGIRSVCMSYQVTGL